MEIMTVEQAREAAKGLTFEDVWAVMMKNETERKEAQKEFEERHRIAEKETAALKKTIDNMSRNLGGLGNLQGLLAESMFSGKLWKRFRKIGYKFTKQGSNIILEEDDRILVEIDYFLENGEYAMPVEIKAKLTEQDIDDHLERISKIRRYMDARNDNRKLVGAVGGAVVPDNSLEYAQKKGLYVLIQSGENVKFPELPKDFKAQEW